MSKADELRALRESRFGTVAKPAKSSRGAKASTRKSVAGEGGAQMPLSVETDPATGGTARKASMARSTKLDKPQPGKEHRPGPRETDLAGRVRALAGIHPDLNEAARELLNKVADVLSGDGCPLCMARRQAKRASMAKWRAKT